MFIWRPIWENWNSLWIDCCSFRIYLCIVKTDRWTSCDHTIDKQRGFHGLLSAWRDTVLTRDHQGNIFLMNYSQFNPPTRVYRCEHLSSYDAFTFQHRSSICSPLLPSSFIIACCSHVVHSFCWAEKCYVPNNQTLRLSNTSPERTNLDMCNKCNGSEPLVASIGQHPWQSLSWQTLSAHNRLRQAHDEWAQGYTPWYLK